ncbi:hypothetical protein LGK99_00540 [Clostridium algidicarnis]|nr:hypothetical protein [Clostridium algidicarnis]
MAIKLPKFLSNILKALKKR